MNWLSVILGGGLIACIVIGLLLLRREARRLGAAAANADTAERQMDALKQAETVKDERLGRMADAAAASTADTVQSARDRMRKRPPTTR